MHSPSNSAVTWLMPVKNGMAYLPEALRSIERQSYKQAILYAWDNGSSDTSVEILNQWIPSRIPGKVFTGKALPLAESLAALVEAAETELLARMDCDDVAKPQRLEIQVEEMSKDPQLGCLGSQIEEIDEQGQNFGIRHRLPEAQHDIVHMMPLMNPLRHPTVLLRRSAVLAVGNYRPRPLVEDYDLWMRLAAQYRVRNSSEALLEYRIHGESVTGQAVQSQALARADAAIVAENAPLLFGIPSEEMALLLEKRHPAPIQAIEKIATFLQASQPDDPTPFAMESFMAMAARLMPVEKKTWAKLLLRNGRGDLLLKSIANRLRGLPAER